MTQRNVLPIASTIVCRDTTAHRTAAPRDVPGSRLLLNHRAAMLRSGSPPGVGPLSAPIHVHLWLTLPFLLLADRWGFFLGAAVLAR